MIIGITGRIGSGKTSVAKFLANKYQYNYISVDDLVKNYIESDNMKALREYLNSKFQLNCESETELCDSYFSVGLDAYLMDMNFKREIDNEIIRTLNSYSENEVVIIDWAFLPKSYLFDKCDVLIKTEVDYDVAKERYLDREGKIDISKYTLVNEATVCDNKKFDLILDTTNNWEIKIENFFDSVINGKNKVSIIVPVYNVEKYLVKCVNSILKQTYKNIEIILVDDGSKDNSLEICNTLAERDSRIKVVHQENQGLSGARNTGLKNATGDYVAFIDSDDYIEKNMIEQLLENAVMYDADVSCGRANIYARDGKLVNFTNADRVVEVIQPEDVIKNYINGKITIASWDKIYKRSALEGMYFDPNLFNEDADYTLRLCLAGKKFVCTNIQYYNYIKRNNGSITGTKFNSRCFITQEWGKRAYKDILNKGEQYRLEAEICLYNSLAHVIRLYMRDYCKGEIGYKQEVQSVANDIMNLLLQSDNVSQFPDLDNVLNIINKLLEDGILDKNQMPYIDLNCIGILWNSLENGMMDEAIEMLKKKSIIQSAELVDLKEDYKDFIYAIYLYNNEKVGIPVFKSSVLIDKYDKNDIVILNMIVRVSSYIFYNAKKGYLYKEVSELKEWIRDYFKNKIRDYAYDNIFHLTVDQEEFEYTDEVCKKFVKRMHERNDLKKYEE